MIIGIAGTNEVKTHIIEEVLKELSFEAQVLPLNVGLEDEKNQLFGFDQIIKGAREKAQKALELQKADMGIGVENGLAQIDTIGWFDFICVAVLTKENGESISFSAGFFIPDWIVSEIKEKKTKITTIIHRLSGGKDEDPFRYFSNQILTREDALKRTLLGALCKIVNHERYHL